MMDPNESEPDEGDPVEDAKHPPVIDYAAKKRRTVILLLVYSALFGVLSCFLPADDTPLDIVVSLPLLILGVSWCYTDAAERNHRLGRPMRLFLILFFFAGFPLYAFQTRGFGAFKTLGLAALLVAAMFICMIAASFATLYAISYTCEPVKMLELD